jgi:integrase
MRLTDITIRNLPAPESGQTTYPDDVVTGFGVRVSQGGTKTFTLVYGRDRRRATIGRVGVIPLASAREEAKRILAEHTLGRSRPRSLSYAEAVRQFLDEKTKARKSRTVRDYKRLLGRLNFAGQLADITHDDLKRKLARFKSEGEYNHLLVAFRVFANWCVKRRYILDNPSIGLSAHATTARARVLTDAELKSIWQATEEPTHYNRIVRLLILTGQRKGEIAALQTSWIHGNTISLPSSVCKNSREHHFPIGQLAVDILQTHTNNCLAHEALIFPAHHSSKKSSLNTFSGWSKSKAALDKASGVKDWTLHDLRRTFATKMAALGVPIHVIERLLNHVSGTVSGVAAIYNRHSYMAEMREAVSLYDAFITKLLGNR